MFPFLPRPRRLPATLLSAAAISAAALAQSAPVSEYAMKATLLFKLPHFVYRAEADRTAPLRICLWGNNPFGSAPEKLAQATIDGRAVRFVRVGGQGEVAGCEYLFISRSEEGEIGGLLRRLAHQPVVTVSDIDGFARAGGMVEFALGGDGAAVSILINRRAAHKQGIEFNAQLLRLARIVEP